ncbi:histidine kinase [Paraburkholderia ginsengiterrae]|uniref:Histidine kinase n=1 Tax=Paraburkholderia ginsengiterrae TaxID=1462993 RepID=A0ABX2UW38_9BURK|nr:histidine kinase [Paraburkholderia ginsengiterrae]
MKINPETSRAAGLRQQSLGRGFGAPAVLTLLTFAVTAGITLAVSRLVMQQWEGTDELVATRAATIVLVAGMAASALFAVLAWLIATSRSPINPMPDEARRNEARMMGIIRSSMEAIITIDDAQNILIFNPTAERVFGVTAMDAIGMPLSRFIPKRFRDAHVQHVTRFGVTGISERKMGQQRVLYGLRANGEEFPLEASISQIQEDSGKLFTVMLRDVTERVKSENALKQSREELRLLSANLQNVREEEKTRIARELHDDLGQQLTALKMDLSAVEQDLAANRDAAGPVDSSVSNQLRGMRRMIDSTVASLRRIAAALRPVMLDDLGLAPAIEWLANDFTSRYGIDITRRIDPGNVVFTKEGATAVFRIVQEALTNVARHADATAVELTLQASDQHYLLRIEDNGRGASQHASPNAGPDKSFGLIGVRERAYMLGGTVQIDTAENKGFAITVKFPLQSVQQEEAHR